MITTVTQKSMVTIPAEIGRQYGIEPGYRLEWLASETEGEIRVRVVPPRAQLAKRLLGAGRKYSPKTDSVAQLVKERKQSNRY
jgi:bifunctional DNA-binding transcriptional regulator/antitoxin component of YhaV-PrlF toxin-antitoxin module